MTKKRERFSTHQGYPSRAILKLSFFFSLLAPLINSPWMAHALPRQGMVQFRTSPGSVCIVERGKASPIYVDRADYPGVVRATNDLALDTGRVSGTAATVVKTTAELSDGSILVGTIGQSPVIDDLIKNGTLDVSPIRGKWESYVIQTVKDPLPGVKQALVIAGSDKRGTIYGIYDVSENIGVSPWYWWADVPTAHHDDVCLGATRIVQGPPAVKYRGIFINDEAPAMSGWTREKFGGFNSKMYVHVFELLLRLKANYLWPAMWGSAFNEDDPDNPRLADEYGIVMGTSHQEPMIRSQAEFDHRFKGDQWDYIHHPDVMEKFWRDGVRRNKGYENLYTMGMRGRNDSEMLPGAGVEANAGVLNRIISRQREILSEEVSPDVPKLPQVLTLYKEVQEFYDHGMKVPDDITLLWGDDNFGNLRRVPPLADRSRSGGSGVYYHFDYVGGPRSYKWLNTNPLPKIQEQMNIAYKNGMDRIWIVNVGDLKPMELPIEFFLTMAWDPNHMTRDDVRGFTQQWAARDFGAAHAEAVADVVSKYAKYNGWRKPESVSQKTYSLINYEEADRVEAAWTNLVREAEETMTQLPAEQRSAFFELALYPAKASATVTDLYIAAARNALYASQGRASTNAQAELVRKFFAEDQGLSDAYNHLLDGRWNHMMDQTHIGYTSWSDPKTNIMPELKQVTPKNGASLGVAIEGSEKAWPGDSSEATLPSIDNVANQRRWIDVFRRGALPVKFSAKAKDDWIEIDQPVGDTSKDCRLWVKIDWNAVPAGSHQGTIAITGDNGESVTVRVPVVYVPSSAVAAKGVFGNLTEAFTIPAAAAAKRVRANDAGWESMPDYGRVASATEVFPVASAPVAPLQAPHLEYQIYLPRSGDVSIRAVIGPTLDLMPGRGLHLAVSVDDSQPQVLDGAVAWSMSSRDYSQIALDNANALNFTLKVERPGRHTLKIWMVDPDVVLEYLIVGTPRPSYFGPPASGVGPTF